MVSRLLDLPKGQAQLLRPPAALLSVRLSLGSGPAKVENTLPQCTLLSLQPLRRGRGAQHRAPPLSSINVDVLFSSGSWLSEEPGEREPNRWRIPAFSQACPEGCLGSNTEGWPGAGLT